MMNLLTPALPKSMLLGVAISKIAKYNRFNFSTDKPNGVYAEQFPANNPIEDRSSIHALENPKGYFFGVFDGHGGDFVSQYVSKTLSTVLEQKLKQNSTSSNDSQTIKRSITQAFVSIEENLFSQIKNTLNVKHITTGSCALVSLIINNTIYVANSGDCEGLLIKNNGNAIVLNKRHNIAEKQQQDRLKKLFPGQNDIAVNSPGGGCYLKGRLQPTYSFGDFYLKYKQFNITRIRQFTGPYVEHRPQIMSYNIANDDKYLILATDGLWDQYSHDEVASIIHNRTDTNNNAGKHLMQTALRKISSSIGVEASDLIKVRNRRNIHDDITFIIVDLQNLNK